MIAIWPAGPPKLMNPSFSQNRNASLNLTTLTTRARSSRHRRGNPVVLFVTYVTAPRVQRVVDHHPVLQHRMVVGEIVRQAERNREQSGGLRRQLQLARVGAAHDR